MRNVEFKKSFDRCYKKLGKPEQLKTDEAIASLMEALETQRIPKGIGLKRIREDLWEIRAELHLRVAFRMNRDLIQFGAVGTHEFIRRLLKEF